VSSTYRDWVKAQATGRMAQCLERDGEKEKAEALYREIREKYPNTPTAKQIDARDPQRKNLLYSGTLLEAQGEYALAMDVYRRQTAKGGPAGDLREAELRIGLCQAALGQAADAVKSFGAFLGRYSPPAGDEAYLRMGRSLEKAGYEAEARPYLEKASAK